MAKNKVSLETTFGDMFLETIKRGIEAGAEEVYEDMKKELVERLDARKDEIIAGISLQLMETVQIDGVGRTLRLRIDKVDNKRSK